MGTKEPGCLRPLAKMKALESNSVGVDPSPRVLAWAPLGMWFNLSVLSVCVCAMSIMVPPTS